MIGDGVRPQLEGQIVVARQSTESDQLMQARERILARGTHGTDTFTLGMRS